MLEEKAYGGQIINTPEVENYPGIAKISGFEFATNLYNQAKGLGATVKFERAVEIKSQEAATTGIKAVDDGTLTELTTVTGKVNVVITESGEYICKSVIIATGAKNRPLGVDREKELIGLGISYCATCDGMFFRGKDVAVVGGGNTALEDAHFLSNYCNKVYVIHRRDQFRGESRLVDRIKSKSNVELVLSSKVVKLLGTDSREGIVVENTIDGKSSQIACQGVFVAIGQMPDNERFKNVVSLDQYGYIVAGEDCKTSCEGIYAAGDCRTKTVRQLTTAAADGAVAAIAACE